MTERPPRKPPWTPEIVRVTEDDKGPDTERVPVPLPEPRVLPARPRLGGREAQSKITPNLLDEVASLKGWTRSVYETQAKMALQLDGFGVTINQRFDVFHKELALLRSLVAQDRKRIDKVESTLGQKVAKGGGVIAVAVVALPMLANALPKYADLFHAIQGWLQ